MDPQLEKIADFIYNRIYTRRMVLKRQKKWALKLGMVAKEDLVDGAKYFGTCRNAETATWVQAKNEFTYVRHKFGSEYDDAVPYPEDANRNVDIFVPMKRIE